MLGMLRKAKKTYVVLITVMLLLPVQQSFAQNSEVFGLAGDQSFAIVSMDMGMTHCQQKPNKKAGSEFDHNNCCDDSSCDSSSCSFSISFIALLPNLDLTNYYTPQQPVFYVEQRDNHVIPSELFRPPRTFQFS